MSDRDDWMEVQNDLRAGLYGYWPLVRDQLVREAIENGAEEIGSSDINHIAYSAVKSGALVKLTDR